ncbi:MAG: hypothetical protein LBH05_06560 [Deferribacteraceae bacterium]|nr:hypothetical protein [Deferribacteraceae bacterium]
MGADGPVVVDSHHREKNRCLIDAVSEMQQMSAGEAMSLEIPRDYFTLSMSIEYFTIGLRAFLTGAIIIFLMLPLAVAASMGMIPFFGVSPTLYDKVYGFIITFAVYSGGLIILVSSRKYIKGEYTKAIAKNMYFGAALAAIFKGILFFFIYQIAQAFINPQKVLTLLYYLKINTNNYVIYNVMNGFKPVLRISSTVVALYSLISVIIIILAYFTSIRRLKKMQIISEIYKK